MKKHVVVIGLIAAALVLLSSALYFTGVFSELFGVRTAERLERRFRQGQILTDSEILQLLGKEIMTSDGWDKTYADFPDSAMGDVLIVDVRLDSSGRVLKLQIREQR